MTAPSRILITGGAGFIGFHLARRLASTGDCRIDLVDNFLRGKRDEDLESLLASGRVNLLERNLLAPGWQEGLGDDYDRIFHFAAIIGVAHVQNRPFEVLRDNTLMLLGILDFCSRQRRLSRLVFTSTSEVYAGTLKHFSLPLPTPETTPLALTDLSQPRTSYMLSKIYGEALCHHSSVPFTIVRPHNFYGPRMGLSHVIPELLQRAHTTAEPGELEIFSADHKRTFCYIDDAVAAIGALSSAPAAAGGTFNIGTQSPEYTMEEVGRVVLSVTGRRLEIRRGPATAGSPARRCPETARMAEVSGVRPGIDLPEGVRRTYEWYKARIFEGQGISAK